MLEWKAMLVIPVDVKDGWKGAMAVSRYSLVELRSGRR